MDPQKIARWFGILFLITFITSIPAFFIFYAPVLNDTDYVLGAGSDGQAKFGALLELILIVANIGIAVVIYPIVRRQTKLPLLDTSPLVSWSAPSSRLASSASSRS